MKNKLLLILILLGVCLVGCGKKEEPILEDEEEISHSFALDREYNYSNSTFTFSSDGTFELKECNEKKKCTTYVGVIDHTDNSIDIYFEKKKEDKKDWEKYDKITKAEVIDDNQIIYEGNLYK